MVMISDEHGRIMEVTGDENALRRGALVNVLPGSSWAENDVGTTESEPRLLPKTRPDLRKDTTARHFTRGHAPQPRSATVAGKS